MKNLIGDKILVKYKTNEGDIKVERILRIDRENQLYVRVNRMKCYVEPVFLMQDPDKPIYFKSLFFIT